jgi:hypothetical protein
MANQPARQLRNLVLIAAVACRTAAAAEPATMDGNDLAYSKARLAAGDPAYAPALKKLLQDADRMLERRPESVTYKKLTPPSGDKHDYLSLAPYWWPDPARPGGLPYQQRDGEFNPSAKNDDTDSVRMGYMCHGIEKLSLAYYFSGERKYALKAAEAIRTWFIDPATRMHPNLKYGQAIMGKVKGRGTGLIDTRNLWMVTDAVSLIEPAGALSAEETAALRQWFAAFADWMRTSKPGQDEARAANNHGTYYDMQLAAYALFTGDTETARNAVRNALDQRIAMQVEDDGSQPRELARTTPFHYSAFNLDAMTTLARYGEQVGVDVWNARAAGHGLRNAINYMLPYAARPAAWPHRELRPVETELMLPILLRAERAYGSGVYAQAAASLPVSQLKTTDIAAATTAVGLAAPSTIDTVDRLIWPVKPARQH